MSSKIKAKVKIRNGKGPKIGQIFAKQQKCLNINLHNEKVIDLA